MTRSLGSLLVALGVTMLCALLWINTANAQEAARAHFINVGRGDASLMEFPCGAVLIDAGGAVDSQAALTGYLDRFFSARPDLKRTLDAVVLTHGHRDHTRHIAAIMQRYSVRTIVVNGHFNKKGYQGLRTLIRAFPQTRIIVADAEHIPAGGLWDRDLDPLDCDGVQGGAFPDIRLLWGDARPRLPGWSEKFYKDENNHSVAVLVRWGNRRVLFTGDLEKQGLRELLARQGPLLRDVDLYQISHHGFRSGTIPEFLSHINPRVAILSRPGQRSWYAPTFKRFNEGLRQTRPATQVPLWTFGTGIAREADTRDVTGQRQGEKTRVTSTGTLSSAVYWTGRDGHIRVDLSGTGPLNVSLDGAP